MEKNFLDIVTDELKTQIGNANVEASRQFKNSNPYRKRKLSVQEQIYNYSRFTPEQYRQNMGVKAEPYIMRMEALKRRYANG